jgi:hypothetical protein
MPRYVIERELPGVGDLSDEQLQTLRSSSPVSARVMRRAAAVGPDC